MSEPASRLFERDGRRLPPARTPLEKAVRKTLVHPSKGMPSLRKHVLAHAVRLRLQGIDEGSIISRLSAIVMDVASTTGDDRTDLVTGEPRSARVASAIRNIVESQGAL
jgi:hypothetical protein